MGKALDGTDLGMGISQRVDGRYIARYTDKYGKRITLYSFKAKEIKKMLRDAVYEDENGIGGNGAKITLDEWYSAWMDLYKKKTIKPTSQFKIKSYHEARISPALGKMYLKDIKLLES